MSEEKKKKYGYLAKITGVIIGLVLVLGVSYAVFRTSDVGKKKNKIITGNLSVRIENEEGKPLDNDTFGIENAVPISAEEGCKMTPYSFNVINEGTIPANYTLYFQAEESSNLSADNIKIALDRTRIASNVEQLTTSIYEQTGANAEDGSLKGNLKAVAKSSLLSKTNVSKLGDDTLYYLDNVTIGPGQSYKYNLRMWLAYASGIEAMNKTFEGKVYIDARQTVKDESYIVEQSSITNKENIDVKNLGYKQYLGIYKDGSVRISGLGQLNGTGFREGSTLLEVCSSTELIKTLNANYTKSLNEVLTNKGYETFESMDAFYDFISGLNEETDIPYDENTINELANIYSAYAEEKQNILDNETCQERSDLNGNLYIDAGVFDMEREFMYGDWIKKVYITKDIGTIGQAAIQSDVEELSFIENTNPFYKDLLKNNKLIINSRIMHGVNLKSVILPENLSEIDSNAFIGAQNAEISILAKKDNVIINNGTKLNDVKTVNWING